MTEIYIDLTISQAQVDTILAGLKAINEMLPGLIELTPEKRKSMARYSDKNLGFIFKTQQIAGQHPEIFPSTFKYDDMNRDIDTQQKLDTLLHSLINLLGKFQDSRYAAACQNLSHGLAVYQFVKTHNALTGELEDAVADLAKHFVHSKPAKSNKPADN